ncbi:Receptor-like protein 43 [Cardamine amara subsp. amara]|uniref:Receptor-like protein 43 n=1 Tax=Cardamine amara subsp. amara TaxID=228776 RepID=A0ABD1AR64_CARAN
MNSFWNSISLIFITLSFFFFLNLNFRDVFASPTRHLCHPEQRDAILQFMNELEIQKPCFYGFPKTESWANNSDCCSWDGIRCDAKFGDVIELNLSLSCLHGQLNSKSDIFRLHNLRVLHLSSNHFSGEIPSSLGNLSYLTTLDLSINHFSGEIPSSLGNLSYLTTLDLSINHFSGEIPSSLGNLSHLTTLEVGGNNFNGEIPSSLGNLSYLTTLDLSINNFSGEIPSSLGRLSQLVSLNVFINKFNGNFPLIILNLTNLSILDISYNQFAGMLPPNISSSLPNLEYFYADHNNFTGKIPSFICTLCTLTILDLSNNQFNGSIPRCMGNFSSTLQTLNLRKNRLSGGLPENISASVKSLDIGHNQLVGKLPRSLVRISFLEVLNVESNRINDTFPFWLSSLQELHILVLRSNAFHGPIQKTGFSKLRIIDISSNHFYGTLPSDCFANWDAMCSLGKKENQFNGEYMGTDYYSDSMVLMNKGVALELVRILKIYTAIDFSGNKFEGEIPRSIGILKELHVLNFSNNAFTGHIPSSMANLGELESLDVSQNKLSGEIPQELGNLSYLAYMNFSHNQLVGLLPGGTQFKTQPCSSFKDNLGLYGPSLDEVCGDIHAKTSHQYVTPEQEEDEEEVISWIAAAIGFIPGIAFGLVMGYIFVCYKPEWFMNPFGRNKRRIISISNH